MVKNENYNVSITAKKGGYQVLNVLTSTAFSSFLVILINSMFNKDFKIDTIQEGINNISGSVVFLTPFVSAAVRMISNFVKKSKKEE